jgi:hypothetical protein
MGQSASESLSAAVAGIEVASSATISQALTISLGVIEQGVAPNKTDDVGIIIGEGIP